MRHRTAAIVVPLALLAPALLLLRRNEPAAPTPAPTPGTTADLGSSPSLAAPPPPRSPDADGGREPDAPTLPARTDGEDRLLASVTTEQGTPVAGVGIVEALDVPFGSPGPYERLLGRSDRDGRVVLLVPARRMRLRTEIDTAWHSDDRFTLPEDRDRLKFVVTSMRTVQGVLRGTDGLAVQGVKVTARYRTGSQPGSTALEFKILDATDADGRFSLAVPSYVSEIDFRAPVGGRVADGHWDAEAGDEILLSPSAAVLVQGEVVDAEGAPVSEGRVRAFAAAGGEGVHLAFLESTHRFVGSVPSPGRYSVVYDDDSGRRASSRVREIDAPTSGVRLVCGVPLRLAGRIEGEDVSGFQLVWLEHRGGDRRLDHPRRARAGPNGEFVFQGLEDGDTLLFVSRVGDSRFGLEERIRLPEDGLVVALREGLDVRGRVSNYTGRRGFDLTILLRWRGPTLGATVADDGSFAFQGVPPGRYGLGWERAGRRHETRREIEAGDTAVEIAIP